MFHDNKLKILNELEFWKWIREYEDVYLISSHGRVKSFHKNKNQILKTSMRTEYLGIQLNKNNIGKTFSIHRLVAETFLCNKLNFRLVNHIDGDKTNNNILNLEWVSESSNCKHALDNKLLIPKCYRVSQYTKDKKTLIQIFNSIKEASEKTGCKDNKISLVCKGKRNQTGNFFWKYTDFEYIETPVPEGKILPEYPNYIITDDGKVYSKSYKKFLSTRLNSGYEYVTLYNKKGKDFSVHNLVAILYIENPNKLPVVNHKNFNRSDNRVENLEWVSYSDNMKHFANNSYFKNKQIS